MTSGYSGKPLALKLGLAPGLRAASLRAPQSYSALLEAAPAHLDRMPEEPVEFLHAFYSWRENLEGEAADLVAAITPGGALWISWPKKASKIQTDITEQTLRDVILPLGLVDVKVCAVDEVWSALLFRHRRKAK